MNEKDEFELKDRADDPMNYSASISSSWQFTGANLTNESMGFISTGNPSSIVRNGELGVPSCPSTSTANPFSANLWDHPTNSGNSGFCNFNVKNSIGASNRTVNDKGGRDALRSSIDRPLDMDWNQQNPLMKEVFSANVPGMLPASLSQLPTDSAFIERAARFSCFNNGNFGEMANHFGIPESMIGAVTMLGRQEVIARNEASKDVSLCMELEPEEKSTLKNERESERPQDKPNQGGPAESGNESDEAGFSGGDGGGQDEPCTLEGAVGEPSTGGLSFKKRKRGGKNTELGQSKEAPRQIGEIVKNGALNQRKGDQNPNLTTNKPAGKQGKQDSQASDGPKQEYIHVRARRGQATNSHSLAERVRREKISERMRLLQDLVPGCSKVTGKAVMLDEIINYVQSLQRQVEFLSMKLATVNPRLDFNVEGLLAKDIIQSRTGPSSFGFSPELSMPYLSQHHSHHGFIPPSLPNMGNPSDLLRRTINSQLTSLVGGFKEPIQLSNVWEDELHNVVQMNVDTTAPSDGQDVNGSIPQQCNMKAEL